MNVLFFSFSRQVISLSARNIKNSGIVIFIKTRCLFFVIWLTFGFVGLLFSMWNMSPAISQTWLNLARQSVGMWKKGAEFLAEWAFKFKLSKKKKDALVHLSCNVEQGPAQKPQASSVSNFVVFGSDRNGPPRAFSKQSEQYRGWQVGCSEVGTPPCLLRVASAGHKTKQPVQA